MPLRDAERPHRCADRQRALDRRQPERRPVQPQVAEGVARVQAGGDDAPDQGDERRDSEQRGSAAPAPDVVRHGVEPPTLPGDDAQAEHRQVLRPLPELQLSDLVAVERKHETHEERGGRDPGGERDERPSRQRTAAVRDGTGRCRKRASEPGVTSPEIKKNSPITNSTGGNSSVPSTMSLTSARRTSRCGW
jgi:hypothetical protein